MTSDGTNCYTYNDANQLSQVKNCSTNQVIAQYVYDYNGNRIEKKLYNNGTLQKTVYSPSDEYETVKLASNGATQNTSYYTVNDQVTAKKNPDGTKNYYLNDNLGSANVLTNQSGTVVEQSTYYPYGQIRSGGTQSKYAYTGQENDPETNLDYYNARYYNPGNMHFTQPDSYTADIYNPQDLNNYSYVKNNPLTYNDPTGHFWAPVVGNAVDIASAAYDVYTITQDPRNITNWGALGLDVAAGVVPLVPDGAGTAFRMAKYGAMALKDAGKGAEAAKDAATIGNDIKIGTSEYKSYKSFDALKKDLGSAGPGNNLHHIVEQSKVSEFGPEAIHNTDNVVNIPAQVNFNINGYYSSKRGFTQGQTVRQWLSGQSYNYQSSFGKRILNQELNKYYRK